MNGISLAPVLDLVIFIALIFTGYLLLKQAGKMLKGAAGSRKTAGLGVGLLGLAASGLGIAMKIGVISFL